MPGFDPLAAGLTVLLFGLALAGWQAIASLRAMRAAQRRVAELEQVIKEQERLLLAAMAQRGE